MTQIITRYFDSVAHAQDVTTELVRMRRFSPRIIDMFTDADGLAEDLTKQHVEITTAKAYQTRMAKGGAVLLVRAGHIPLRVAHTTRTVMAEMGAVDMGDLVEEVWIKDDRKPGLSIMDNHPHFLTRLRAPGSSTYHMANWPIPLLSRAGPSNDTLMGHNVRFGNYILPLTIRRKPPTRSIFARHARMANFPIGLISKRKPYDGFAIPRHGRMANFPLPLLSRRKPYTGALIARHGRWASVPFPLLINGRSNNSLMPGAPRMANFPISLLSDRKPYTGSAIPRHGRMANFPLPLISKRKPYDGFAIPRHGRMADAILPLVTRRENARDKDGGSGWSFSKMLGWPTISPR